MKPWKEARCNFEYKTFVEITYFNTESDFRTTRYPDVGQALEDQHRKLGRDVIRRVGKDNMDEVLSSLVG